MPRTPLIPELITYEFTTFSTVLQPYLHGTGPYTAPVAVPVQGAALAPSTSYVLDCVGLVVVSAPSLGYVFKGSGVFGFGGYIGLTFIAINATIGPIILHDIYVSVGFVNLF